MTRLWLAALAVMVLNLPFGYWRAGTRKYSLPWFAAVHAPVPGVIVLRLVAGLGWQAHTYLFLVGGYVAGQYLGARWRRARQRAPRARRSPS